LKEKEKEEVEMRRKRLMGGTCAAVMLIGLLAAATAHAQPTDKRTFFTFSGAVEIPGATLQAGKYVFHLADPDTGRTVVQITSADGKRVYGMFFSRSAERTTAASDAEVRLMEAPRGVPPAIRTWWYPGERTGREFVYPKQQARRIAERTHQAVLTTVKETTTTNETNTTELTRVSPTGSETSITADNAADDATPSGSAQTGERAPAPAPAPTRVGTVARARTHLPQTASASPLVALIGVLLLVGATVIRVRRAQRA
jgi:LPXTG-motif cell wall-anchored protein